MSEIIAANLDHVPLIAALGYKSFQETGADLPPPNLKKVLDSLMICVLEGVIFIDYNKEEKEIKGVMAIAPITSWWSEYDILNAMLFYIQPEYRGGRTFIKLVKAAKEYADAMKAPILIENFNRVNMSKKQKAVEKMGFTPISCGLMYGSF